MISLTRFRSHAQASLLHVQCLEVVDLVASQVPLPIKITKPETKKRERCMHACAKKQESVSLLIVIKKFLTFESISQSVSQSGKAFQNFALVHLTAVLALKILWKKPEIRTEHTTQTLLSCWCSLSRLVYVPFWEWEVRARYQWLKYRL